MKKKICIAVILIGLFILIGTYGAIENGQISVARGVIRIAIDMAVIFAALFAGRVWEA